MRAPVDRGVEGLGELHHRLLEAVLQDAVGVLDARADALRLPGHRDVGELGVDHLLELEGQAVDERVVHLVERQRRVPALEDPPLDVREEQPRLGDDEGEGEDGVPQVLLRQARRVGVLQVVQEPEELQEHLGRLAALQRVRDPADDPAHRAGCGCGRGPA